MYIVQLIVYELLRQDHDQGNAVILPQTREEHVEGNPYQQYH